MKELLNDFKLEIKEIYKCYRISHFSMYLTKQNYSLNKELENQIQNFKIIDEDLNEEISFTENNILVEISENGKYQNMISGNTIVMFYQLWEDKFRKQIADKLSVEKNDVKSFIFSDLNILRQSIIHNNYKPIKEFKKISMLNFNMSDSLKLSSKDVSIIYHSIIQEINKFEIEYCK